MHCSRSMVLRNLQRIRTVVRRSPTVLVVGEDGCSLDIFLSYFIPLFFSLALGDGPI